MSDENYTFKVGDRVVLAARGPDQPEGVVTRINGMKTCPWVYTVSVAFESGEKYSMSPAGLRLSSEKAGLPVARTFVQPSLPDSTTPRPSAPLQAPDLIPEVVSEAALAAAIKDWECAVKCIESGFDYSNQIEEYQHDVFSREILHAQLLAFTNLKLQVPVEMAAKIAKADQRYLDLTLECSGIWGGRNFDPMAFWYYFRWPRKRQNSPPDDAALFDAVRAADDGFRIPASVVNAKLEGEQPVKAWRDPRGLTQEALADALAVTVNDLSED